ncbi:MAG: DNA-processing protein DprA [Roseovarius sp.]
MFEDKHPSTHPPHPPTTEDDRISWLRLLRSRRVGPQTFHRLMAEHGSAARSLEALPEVARAAGVTSYSPAPPELAIAELQTARAIGAHMLCIGAPGYPALLAQTEDAPPVLWALGCLSVLDKPRVSFVGARNASSLGMRMTRMLAGDLAEQGFAIVSGLARGIDTAAHLASLEEGTIAVMAGGVDVIYPAENVRLGEDILRHGLRVSEHPFGVVPQARHFPSRNRIISALSPATVVVEAAAKSGSLITARAALDQGREVMAVPGHPFEPRAAGCNMLLRDGGILVRSAQDVIEALPTRTHAQAAAPEEAAAPAEDGAYHASSDAPPPSGTAAMTAAGGANSAPQAPAPSRSLRDTAALHDEILRRLSATPLAEDQLIRDMGTPAARLTPSISELELSGLITRHPGGLISRADLGPDRATRAPRRAATQTRRTGAQKAPAS